MDVYLPYALMFLGSALTTVFDIHAKHNYLVIERHKLACAGFAIIMGFVGIFVFWSVGLLQLLNPGMSPLVASVILFLGYRVLIQSNLFTVKIGTATRPIGFAWLYEGSMFLFFDFIKSREKRALQGEYAALSVVDLAALAKSYAKSAEDRERIESISNLNDENFKRNWLAKFCADAQEPRSKK